jgi:phage repressor protein C with HTH and peptisase S24 domain
MSLSSCCIGRQTTCELSHRQGVILRRLSAPLPSCDMPPMVDQPNIAEIRQAVREAMERKGVKAKRLSKDARLGETAVRDLMEKVDDPRVGTLIKIADALEMPVSSLFGGKVPVLGKIGAGGSILFEESTDPELVDRPPGAAGRLMALKVAGDSMFPVYRDGDVVYVGREHEGVLPEYLGEECAIHTAEGGTFLKILTPGTEAGRYTLRSFNAPDMENVEVVWASRVEFVMRSRKKAGADSA